MDSFKGEVIWLTGASSGIGRSLALRLANAGARVIVSGRNSQALETLAEHNPNITPLIYDVSDATLTESTKNQLLSITHHLDRVIINAGNCEYLDITEPDWTIMQRMVAVNYLGAVNTVAAALPLLLRKPGGGGHIVGIVSLVTVAPFARAEAYGASKAALQYFLDALRVDLKKSHIDVMVINPGFVKTPLTEKNDFPMPFLLSVDNAAERIAAAILRRRRQYDFPKRLKWLLKLLMSVPGLWHALLGPALKR